MKELSFTTKQTMSSREISELTGKLHKNVLVDCDKLNESYLNLGLAEISAGVYFHQNTGEQQHREYLLTKIQTLDLMTGYNTELRIKVNRRWEELETKTAIDFTNPDTVLQLAQNWKDEQTKRIEAEKLSERLKITAELQAKELKESAPKVQYHDEILASEGLILTNTIADELGISAKKLNLMLRDKSIIYQQNGTNMLYANLRGKGYEKYKTHAHVDSQGKTVTTHLLCWTEKGREFIHKLIGKHEMQPA